MNTRFLLFFSLIFVLTGAGCLQTAPTYDGVSYCPITIERDDLTAHFVAPCDWIDNSTATELHLESPEGLANITYTKGRTTIPETAVVSNIDIDGETYDLYMDNDTETDINLGIFDGPAFEELGGAPSFTYPPTSGYYNDIMSILTSVEIERPFLSF